MCKNLDGLLDDLKLVCRLNNWDIKIKEHLATFKLYARDGEQYIVLFECLGYPEKTPSVLFINDQGDQLDATAWPRGNASFLQVVKPPPNCFLCMPLTREGLDHHNEWKGSPDAWDSKRHTLKDLMNYIYRLLTSLDYEGRGK